MEMCFVKICIETRVEIGPGMVTRIVRAASPKYEENKDTNTMYI